MKRHQKNRHHKSIVESLEPRVAPATFTVANLNDAGAGSLRQAILDANATPALDTIVFKAGLTGTLEISGGQFAVTKPLSIKGPGGAKVILNGGGNSGIFEVNDGSISTDSPFSISGLSLIGGSDASGGGAIASSESLTVLNCTLSGNTAAGNGGAILATGKIKVSITGSQISGNTTTSTGRGGGVYIHAEKGVSIIKSVFSGNSSLNEGGGLQLGIGVSPLPTAKVLVVGCTIIQNSAMNDGGGLEINMETGDSAVVQNSIISGNVAGGDGGGFYFDEGKLTMTNTIISANSADFGGGAFFDRAETVLITASKFLGNTASDNGTSGTGGGIVFQKGGGAGIYKLNACTVAGNTTAGAGGGIWLSAGASLTMTGGVIHGNRAEFDGGGILTNGNGVEASPLTLKSVTISENVAVSDTGGGLAALGDGAVSITGTKFLYNKASSSGGAYLRSATTITVLSSLFQANSVSNAGGGFQIGSAGAATFTSVKVLQNSAASFGGGFTNTLAGTLTLSKSLVSGNYSGASGGGGVVSPLTTLQKTIVTANIAKTSGGGFLTIGQPVISADSKVTGNIAPSVPNM
jgi:predicted outer membrane repeat protein